VSRETKFRGLLGCEIAVILILQDTT